MSARLYVGNIPFKTTEQELRDLFGTIGPVTKVDIVMERDTGRPRGFAFVEMDEADCQKAIDSLGGTGFGGRNLTVNAAKERPARSENRGPRESQGRNRDW